MNSIELETPSGNIPESLFATFQMTFAIITPALMIVTFVERIKFSAMLIFLSLWVLIVYVPVTHWVWAMVFCHLGEQWTFLEASLCMQQLVQLL